MKWTLLALAIAANSLGNILVKKFALDQTPASPGAYLHPVFLLGIGFFGINVLFYTQSLRSLPIEIAYPILIGLSLVIISLAAPFLFRAHIGVLHIAGMALILAGVSLLARLS